MADGSILSTKKKNIDKFHDNDLKNSDHFTIYET